MFTYIRRVFPHRQFFLFILILFGASYIHPATRDTLQNVVAPYQAQIATWSDVLISILTVAAVVGLVAEIRSIYRWFHSYGWFEFSLVWIINLLLLLHFVGIKQVANQWMNYYSTTYNLHIKPYFALAVDIIGTVLAWGIPILIIGIVFWAIAVRKRWDEKIKEYIQAKYKAFKEL